VIEIAPPTRPPVDWDGWRTPLRQFAEATGLVVSARDASGGRQVGPFTASRTAALLASSRLWAEDGPGTVLERRLVAEVLAAGAPATALFGDALKVCASPLTLHGEVYGVLVFGWRFRDFSSPMECERLARGLDLAGHLLWNEVRLEAPVSDTRMDTYAALLATLATSIDRQRETIADLDRVNRARDLFLATVSHEMRTPLSALSLRIEVLLRTVPDLPPAATSALEAMRKHVRQEAGMIDDLIDAAKTLTGHMSIVRTPVMLGQVLRDAISTVEAHAHQKQILLQVTPADYGDRIGIAADAGRLQQVFWNLLFNAIKFTPEGGSIRVTLRQLGDGVEIDVTDSGQGIPADAIAHVFGAFTLQTQGNDSGLGLGLYIARRIVELHGGTISVSSPGPGRGTTFAVRLPAGQH
jgi:signal transduction histidine kinase